LQSIYGTIDGEALRLDQQAMAPIGSRRNSNSPSGYDFVRREIPIAVSTADTSAPLTTEPAGSVINPLRLPLDAAVCASAGRTASMQSVSAQSAVIYNSCFEHMPLLLKAAFFRHRCVIRFLRINQLGDPAARPDFDRRTARLDFARGKALEASSRLPYQFPPISFLSLSIENLFQRIWVSVNQACKVILSVFSIAC
jgi:hypothetical protein